MSSFVSRAEQRVRAEVPVQEVASIDTLEIQPNTSTIYLIGGEALPYAAFLKAPNHGAPLLVFGQGYQDRKSVTLPRFQRMDWAFKLKYNVLIFSDPTLHLSPATALGWCLGTHDHYVLPRIMSIVARVRDFLGIDNRNLLFFGSSAGGFTSLMLASHFEGSSTLVNNPQTDVLKFRRGGVQNLLKLGFGGASLEQARTLYGERMSFIERLRRDAHIPRIYYLQNLLDLDHYQDQMVPLMMELQSRSIAKQGMDLSSRFVVDLYSDAKALHNPVGFEKIESCLNSISYWFE